MAKRIGSSIKNFSLASVVALCLTGCNMYKLEELRQATPSGSPFQNELSRLYMDYSIQAEKGYDWSNSWHFADKGLMLAYGKDVPPENPQDWDIPDDVRPEMEKIYAGLMAVLTPELMRASPSKAAEAQFYFDCWVKEQEQNWREEHIANCRDNITRLLYELNASGGRRSEAQPINDEVKKPFKPAKKPAPEKPKKEDDKPAKPSKPEMDDIDAKEPVAESTSYAVFFEADKAEVSEPGMNVITEVIKSLRNASDYSVILHNSKEHPGKAAERIAVIKKLLVAGGVKDSAIRIGLGKTEVESGKINSRRVEIFLNE